MQITIQTNKLFYHPTKKWVEAGTEFTLDVDIEGTPLNSFWASVLKESKIDNAISILPIVEEKVITTNSKPKK